MLNKFPDELVPNSRKKEFSFGKEYATAIWNEWSAKYDTRALLFKKLRKYADGKQDIEQCKSNIKRKYINESFLHVDWNDKLNLLTKLLRKAENAVDLSEFRPSVYAIDPTARKIKEQRKKQKEDLFFAKDLIEMMAQAGQAPVPMEQIPQSLEQVELEEETAKPLDIETAEEMVLQFVGEENNLSEIHQRILRNTLVEGLGAVRVETDNIEGIKIRHIDPENFLHSPTKSRFFSDCRYFAEVQYITVAQLKKIAQSNGIAITPEDIESLPIDLQKETDYQLIRVLNYCFKTHHHNVYKKKVSRKGNAIRLIDRTNDEGTENAYKPKYESDISERLDDIYDVWYEGIMMLDGTKKVVKHQLMENMPEYAGKLFPPYVAQAPRMTENGYNSIVEEVIPRVDSIQELRYRIVHERNILKGNITMIDPDSIANIALGQRKLTPEEVLSFYFSLNLGFIRTKDSEGDEIKPTTAVTEQSAPIPYKMRELMIQFVEDVKLLNESFGYIGADEQKMNEDTLFSTEPYRLSDNNSMKDYSSYLLKWTVLVYQVVSTRINDIFKYSDIKKRYEAVIGEDDMETFRKYRTNRYAHYYGVYIDNVLSREERISLLQNVQQYVQAGILDPLDAEELLSIKNKKLALRILRLRIEARQQKAQEAQMQQQQQASNANIEAARVAHEGKMNLAMLEHQNKMEQMNAQFEQKAVLLKIQGDTTVTAASISANNKQELEAYRKRTEAEIAMMKKQKDEDTRMKAINQSAKNQSRLIGERRGDVSPMYQEDEDIPQEVDLSTLNEE